MGLGVTTAPPLSFLYMYVANGKVVPEYHVMKLWEGIASCKVNFSIIWSLVTLKRTQAKHPHLWKK